MGQSRFLHINIGYRRRAAGHSEVAALFLERMNYTIHIPEICRPTRYSYISWLLGVDTSTVIIP
jgi:hypothetical protein